MTVGVPRETSPGEQRVALVPSVIPALAKSGLEVLVETEAGTKAGYANRAYEEQGARIVPNQRHLFSSVDIILRVRGYDGRDAGLAEIRQGHVVVGLLNPFGMPQAIRDIARSGATAFALEFLPRISRAQPMDALTSMATVAGYKAVLLAAGMLKRMSPMMITAAGTLTPARVLVIGAGVAGLQAIATFHRLGAVVQAYDVRPAVKEQVESLGAKFVELKLESGESEAAGGYAKAMGEDFYQKQRELMQRVVAESDAVISTAAVPGQKAPVLITQEMVQGMKPGSVIIDLAAETGGNCELTKPGETIEAGDVTIAGPLNLPSTIPFHASQMYARNISAFLQNLVVEGSVRLNMEDEIIRDTLLTRNGEIVNARMRAMVDQR